LRERGMEEGKKRKERKKGGEKEERYKKIKR